MENATWTIAPCPADRVRALVDGLGVGADDRVGARPPRLRATPSAARAFLEGALPGHDPFLLGDMREAVEAIRAAVAAGARICVHGDYDADGICATALAVLLLRELGAEPEWHLPSRFEEGYGLNGETLARLAADGVELRAHGRLRDHRRRRGRRRRGGSGSSVVVTDHHRPGETFPDCPVVAPLKGAYPFAGPLRHRRRLEARRGAARRRASVPRPAPRRRRARDGRRRRPAPRREPRARARSACAGSRRRRSPGCARSCASRGVDPAACDEGAIGFRLAPRINAAGRLGRPEAALELLLTDGRPARRRGSPTSSRR